MSYARQLLDAYPVTVTVDADLLAATIDAVSDCAQACTADTDADLGEQNLAEMVTCVRLCLNCTDICTATAGVISRLAGYDPSHQWPVLRRWLESAQAAYDPGGGGADIGAVQAQPDARDHFGQVLLAQVSVGVGGAGPGRSRWPRRR